MSQILGWLIASILAIATQTGAQLPPPPTVPADPPAVTQTAMPTAAPTPETPVQPKKTKPQATKPAITKPAVSQTAKTATEAPKPVLPADTGTPLSNDNYYVNSAGNTVHSPAYSEDGSVPAGASARCRDGTYSFSQHRRGTCSHHGGVAEWL